MTKAYRQMSVGDALYTAARKYPGSVEALAGRMGRSANVLRSKLKPDVDTHHITLEEALQIIELLDSTVPHAADLAIKAIAYRLGRIVVRHEGVDSSDETLERQANTLGKSVIQLVNDLVQVSIDAAGGPVPSKAADTLNADIASCMDALYVLKDTIEQWTGA